MAGMARILLIEDSPTEATVMARMLERKGHVVLMADNAEEGITVCRREKPDLVLMDVVLPGMNGFQATRTLSHDAETRDIPILIVSTKAQETDRVWGMRQGAKAYIVKPVRESDLLEQVANLIGH
jgi:twitching motility two-component system response regulator PilH